MVLTEQLTELRDPFASGLTHWDLLEMYGTLVMARALSERMWLLNRSGKAPFIVTGEGHEGADIEEEIVEIHQGGKGAGR